MAQAAERRQAVRLVVSAALGLALFAAPVRAQEGAPVTLVPGQSQISVEAEGEVRARPDVMTISAGATTTGATAQAAMAANSALVDRLINVIRSAGISPSDIRTSDLSVAPRIAGDGRDVDLRPRILGYVARNQLRIRFRDLNRASAIIDSLFAAGANEVDGPRFSLADPVPAQRAAIAEARAEADNIASTLGKKVGRLLRVSDRRVSSIDSGVEIIVSGSRAARVVIEPGELEIVSSVFVDWELVDR
jgi:uncharacterized protein YggE